MPKMYSLYSLASMLPRKSSQAVISRFSKRDNVSFINKPLLCLSIYLNVLLGNVMRHVHH